MFVQVIKGKTNDAAGLDRQLDRWDKECLPGAAGFLGSTGGTAADGTTIAIVRFDDQAAAQANAARPEQSSWWQETVKLFDGEPSFRESSDVAEMFGGGSNDAGFVQIMEGTVKDRAKAESFETPEMLEQLRKARPDLIGSLRVWFPDDSYVDAAYFTSESDARKGETSADFEGPQQEYVDLFGDMAFIDLSEPRLR